MEIRLLGEVALLVRGRPVDLGPPRQRCAWAALAVDAGRVVPVERLVRRVWGEDPPLRARATLLTYLSRLRQAAGVVSLTRRSGGYVLQVDGGGVDGAGVDGVGSDGVGSDGVGSDGVGSDGAAVGGVAVGGAVDLHRFRALRVHASTEDLARALELWRGDPLTGVTGDWAEAERDRLRQERLAAQHEPADAVLRAGRGGELVAELSARAAEHPLDERVAGQYLLALHRAGRTADALAHYRRVRDRLVEELGAEPGAALRELHGRILEADPALTAPVEAPPAPHRARRTGLVTPEAHHAGLIPPDAHRTGFHRTGPTASEAHRVRSPPRRTLPSRNPLPPIPAVNAPPP
ncbi:AfsR/SARP family transcriptional regulator [Saccharothrix xinjiangensis]|uniref:AfsR/SARP family transcriptional regulator n=1 Tax=Saccharothrix xinjiangensis TaxID=204798 RepID=A0ABV9Y2Q4_9PSEU